MVRIIAVQILSGSKKKQQENVGVYQDLCSIVALRSPHAEY
jgi:hypothetical protein